MKQQVICMECRAELRKLFPTDAPYPGEHVRFVEGIALRDYVCDHCGNAIGKGNDCCAHSIWADHGRVPYYPWEEEFIHIDRTGMIAALRDG